MLRTSTLVIILFLILVINHMSCESTNNSSSSSVDNNDEDAQQQQELVIKSSDINSVVDINETSVVANPDQVDQQKGNETQDKIVNHDHDQELTSGNTEKISETSQVNEQETTQVQQKPIEEESNEKKLFGMPSINNDKIDNDEENFDSITTREEIVSSINYPLAFGINPLMQKSLTEFTFLENYLLSSSSSNSLILSPLISFLSQKNPVRVLLKLLLKSLSNSF